MSLDWSLLLRNSLLYAAAGPALACSGMSSIGVHVNQVGYLPHTQKVAVIESEAAAPQQWQLVDGSGAVVASGVTQARGRDPESGDDVHWADFSSFQQSGPVYRLRVAEEESLPFSIGPRVFRQLKYDALSYFYHNRCGTPIELPYAGEDQWTRPAGHLSDRSVPYKGSETPYQLDVSGGWYDAGDHGKYVVNGGIATWTLLNWYERALHLGSSAVDFGDGKLNIPEHNNGVPDLLDEARWEIEFLLRMQIPRGLPFAGMAHHKIHDASWTAIPHRPPSTTDTRFLHPPSTAATLNLAAVAAQAARIWRKLDPAFAKRCRQAAVRAWNAARRYPNKFAPSVDSQGGGPYDDDHVADEQYWAGAELYLSLEGAKREILAGFVRQHELYGKFPALTGHERVRHRTSMTWQGTAALGAISLAVVPNALPPAEIATIRRSLVAAADGYLELIARQGYRLPMQAGTDGHYPWGSNSFVANNAVVLALAHDFTQQPKYLNGVVQGIDYLLGRNPLNLSYVAGYGSYAFENPHHRFWAHGKTSLMPPPAPGTLAGGPNSKVQDPTSRKRIRGCELLKCYVDHVEAWSVNEVAINWNAPLSWVAAFLDEQGQRDSRPTAPRAGRLAQEGEPLVIQRREEQAEGSSRRIVVE